MIERKLELLSPAANIEIARQAILHGADAVYIGGPSHGARKSVSNSLDDIASLVDFAHGFRSKVYVTVNTIVFENEIAKVEKLCRDLYHSGVDALIVQDMGLLRMHLPPVSLHASTQCDIRTPEKARFLQDAGFSQLVLARELTIGEIKDIVSNVDIPVECFVHGALCVSYSGRCHASYESTGRSANRGECSQICRLPFTLKDADGRVLVKDRHLLSLKDFNAYGRLEDLIDAGVASFKIEGRLKDMDYVKNITAFYSRRLDSIISRREGLRRSSCGSSSISFVPDPFKSFNRGFTDYFLSDRRPDSIASILTPKSLGEIVTDMKKLHNGDGISFFDEKGEYRGVNINKADNGRIVTARGVRIPYDAEIHRTFDLEWQKTMNRVTADRKLSVKVRLDETGVSASDERGLSVRIPLEKKYEQALKPVDYIKEFGKLGNTIYKLECFSSALSHDLFIPNSDLGRLRRALVTALDTANLITYPYEYRRQENPDSLYPYKVLDYKDNVANSLAEKFYMSHGVESIGKAMEVAMDNNKEDRVVMTTRHCILRELGMCRRGISQNDGKGMLKRAKEPFILTGGNRSYRLRFDCSRCEMQLLTLS